MYVYSRLVYTFRSSVGTNGSAAGTSNFRLASEIYTPSSGEEIKLIYSSLDGMPRGQCSLLSHEPLSHDYRRKKIGDLLFRDVNFRFSRT